MSEADPGRAVISAQSKPGLDYEVDSLWIGDHKSGVAGVERYAASARSQAPQPTSTEPVAQLSKFPRAPVGATFSSNM